MIPLRVLTGVAAPLILPNIDTDAIIPSREMKQVSKTGLAEGLFAGWRYREVGSRASQPDFVLNQPAYAGASILLAGENFGCGSSREHAVWALAEYGFRAILAPSFSPIFANNCLRNSVLAAVIPADFIAALADETTADPQVLRITVDLPAQRVIGPGGLEATFEIGEDAKAMLLDGLDVIDLTLKRSAEIDAFRETDRAKRPWAYLGA